MIKLKNLIEWKQEDVEKIYSIFEEYKSTIKKSLEELLIYYKKESEIPYGLEIKFRNSVERTFGDIEQMYFRSDKGNVYASYSEGTINIYNDDLKSSYDYLIDFKIGYEEDHKTFKHRKISELNTFFDNFEKSLDSVAHEYAHYWDDIKVRSKNYGGKDLVDLNLATIPKIKSKIKSKGKMDANEVFRTYVNKTWEVNAHLFQRLFSLKNVNSVQEFLNAIQKNDVDIRWISNLSPENKKRILKRIYKFYQK